MDARLARLEQDNKTLRQQLEALLREARNNEEKMRRFDRLEHRLIGARSFLELLHLLLTDYRSAFGLEFISLSLVDRELEIRRLLGPQWREDTSLHGLSLLDDEAPLLAVHGQAQKPWLGIYSLAAHGLLFTAVAPGALGSVALLPLRRHGVLIGSLHFGSADRERYDSGAGTDLLERLAGLVGVCVESTLNQERLKLAGLTDGLTGVHNRRYFEHRCQAEVAQARRHRHPLACMFLDIDEFKRINDTLGHQRGDEVLRAVGRSIQGQLRAGDTIARYGGEEFVVLLPQTAAPHAREIAERIRRSIAAEALATAPDRAGGTTISIGVAMLPEDPQLGEPAELAQRLVEAADKALYRAKHAGRNRVEFAEA
ncbi:MAG: DUF484 family protein [Burkholderiaceae bacterium]